MSLRNMSVSQFSQILTYSNSVSNIRKINQVINFLTRINDIGGKKLYNVIS